MVHGCFGYRGADNFRLCNQINEATKLIIHASESKIVASVDRVVDKKVSFVKCIRNMLPMLLGCIFISCQEIPNLLSYFRLTPLGSVEEVFTDSLFAFNWITD